MYSELDLESARALIVDEKALIDAHRSGKLEGTALDVYDAEPPENLELVKLHHFICTPQ